MIECLSEPMLVLERRFTAENRRTAFTVTELLVVFAIIVVLMAILLPAVQRIRETANRMHCGNNLRQIGIAAAHYDADHQQLPPGQNGLINWSATAYGPTVGPMPYLLPYFEQDELYAQFMTDVPPDYLDPARAAEMPAWFKHPGGLEAGARDIPLLSCPSDLSPSPSTLMAHFGGYNAPAWSIWFLGEYREAPVGKTNYLGVAGYLGSGQGQPYPGIFVDANPPSMSQYPYWDPAAGGRRVSLANVAENAGSSNTLMFGESTANAAGGNTFAWSWTTTALPTAWGLPTTETGLNGAPGCFTFSSRHRGIVNFVCADGAVRGIKSGFDPWGIEGDVDAYKNFIYASSWTTARGVDWSKLEF